MQNREPPAYQEYASSVLSKIQFREMTLAERGLLYTLKLECWVNYSVPKNKSKLSSFLGVSLVELEEILPAIMDFFAETNDRIFCPELDSYRSHLLAINEGRKRGADAANAVKLKKKQDAQASNERSQKSRSSVNPADAKSTLPSLVKSSSVQPSTDHCVVVVKSNSNTISLRGGRNDYSYDPDVDESL